MLIFSQFCKILHFCNFQDDGDVIMMTIVATTQTNKIASIPTETAQNPNALAQTECAFTNQNSATVKTIAKTTPMNSFATTNATQTNFNVTVHPTVSTNVGNATVTATVPTDPMKKIVLSVPAPPGNSHAKPPNYVSMPNGFVTVKMTARTLQMKILTSVKAGPASPTDTDATTRSVFYGPLSVILSKIVRIILTNLKELVRLPMAFVILRVFGAKMENVLDLI